MNRKGIIGMETIILAGVFFALVMSAVKTAPAPTEDTLGNPNTAPRQHELDAEKFRVKI
jgi:hypothetical protein